MVNIGLTVVGWVLPILLGPIVYFAGQALLNGSQKIDDLPPAFKRIAIVVLSSVLVAIFNAAGVTVPVECQGTEVVVDACVKAINAPAVLKALTAAAVAFLMHFLKKQRPNA